MQQKMHVFRVPQRLRADSEGNLQEGTSEFVQSADDNNLTSEQSDSTTSAAAIYNTSHGMGN